MERSSASDGSRKLQGRVQPIEQPDCTQRRKRRSRAQLRRFAAQFAAMPVLAALVYLVGAGGCSPPPNAKTAPPAARAAPERKPFESIEAARRREWEQAHQVNERPERSPDSRSPDPRSEAALRDLVKSVQRGEPNYDAMAPELAAVIRSSSAVRERIQQLGAIRTLEFRGVKQTPSGLADRYEAEMENGRVGWLIGFAPSGLIRTLFFGPGQERRTPLGSAEFETALRAELERATAADRFSGTLLVARHSRPIFESAHGLAARERGIKNEMDTRFRIGSMNKMFTAVAVLQLAEAGRLRLEDPLGAHLPNYPNERLRREVTVHHLLSHTGGTGDIFGPKFTMHRSSLLTLADYVALYGRRNPFFEPGGRFEYSNYGFILLGRVIEQVSGQSYYDYVREHVFATAGMKRTGSLPESTAVDGRSIGYLGPPGELQSNVDTLPPRGTSAGGGYSTVRDLLRFAVALQSGRLLPPSRVEQLTRGVVDMPGPAGFRYGRGFMEGRLGQERWFGHGGGAPGMNGELRVLPDSGYVVVALCNLDPPAASAMVRFAVARLPE